MFDNHQSQIQEFAWRSPDNMARVLQFVILTIQTPLYRVAQDWQTAERGGDDAMGVLYGFKFDAYNHVWFERDAIAWQLWDIRHHAHDDDDLATSIVGYIASLPGFGIAKAGFVAQLICGVSGCIDSHNLKRFGIRESTFAHYKARKTRKGRGRMLSRYHETIQAQGGTRELWDGWCAYVATSSRYASAYRDAEHVSAMHVDTILGKPWEIDE